MNSRFKKTSVDIFFIQEKSWLFSFEPAYLLLKLKEMFKCKNNQGVTELVFEINWIKC